MKLNAFQIQRVSSEAAMGPVAETANAHGNLKQHFGDHTFFLSPSGAFVWEPKGEPDAVPLELQALQIASWADEQRTLLQRKHPEPTGMFVTID